MIFKDKEVRITIVGDAKKSYQELNKIVGNEIARGIDRSFNQTLFNTIKQKTS